MGQDRAQISDDDRQFAVKRGRSLRAALAIVMAWVGLRTMILLDRPEMAIDRPASRIVTAATTTAMPPGATNSVIERGTKPVRELPPAPFARGLRPANLNGLAAQVPGPAAVPIVAPTGSDVTAVTSAIAQNPLTTGLSAPPQDSGETLARRPSRARLDPVVSAWAIVRPSGTGSSLATNGQLGASQAGMRIEQRLSGKADRHPIALNIRLSKPLGQNSGTEAGIGVALRFAAGLPAELIVERRIALDHGGRSAVAVIAAGGFDDRPMAAKLRLSGYVQGGVVGAAQRDGFIDGAARVERPLGQLRMGAGLWGGAQPGVSRLDAGPLIAMTRRVGPTAIRLSAEYRWRVSGRARPGSGPALSIATSF